MSSFHVDARIDVKLELELALRLGDLFLACDTDDKQIVALGHMLSNIDKDDPVPNTQSKWAMGNNYGQASPSITKVSTMREKVSQASLQARPTRRHSLHDEKWGVE